MRSLNFLYKSNLSHRAIAVYMYLDDRANILGECWPSIQTMSKELKMSPSTIRRALRDLRESGYVETVQRYRRNGGDSSLLYKLKGKQ